MLPSSTLIKIAYSFPTGETVLRIEDPSVDSKIRFAWLSPDGVFITNMIFLNEDSCPINFARDILPNNKLKLRAFGPDEREVIETYRWPNDYRFAWQYWEGSVYKFPQTFSDIEKFGTAFVAQYKAERTHTIIKYGLFPNSDIAIVISDFLTLLALSEHAIDARIILTKQNVGY